MTRPSVGGGGGGPPNHVCIHEPVGGRVQGGGGQATAGWGHEATDTQLRNAPLSKATGPINVLLHCSTSKPILNVALDLLTGYRMFLRLAWVSSCRSQLKHTRTMGLV